MDAIISALLLSFSQMAAILLFLMYRELDAFHRKPRRLLFSFLYIVLFSLLQYMLHQYVQTAETGAMPTLPFLSCVWLLNTLFLYLWARGKWNNCCFIAFVFLLIDNSIWPIVSSLSRSIWGFNYLYEGTMGLRVLFLFGFALLECLLSLLVRKQMPDSGKLHLNRYHVILAMTIALLFLTFRSYIGQNTDQSDKSVQIFSTLCCLIAAITLAAMVGYNSSEYEKQQNERTQAVLLSQQMLFEQKLQDADLINRKYHDMKNILLYLKYGEENRSASQEPEQLLQSISSYGNLLKTGNTAMDVILSEKLSVCQTEKITCIPYVNGAHFQFVSPLDLCTIFGNSMDNAIESCQHIPDPSRRIISLHSVKKDSSVILTIRNTFNEKPDLRNGLPVTTKKDHSAHGYGLRNMQMIAEKYDGTLSCRIEGEEFVLTILLSQR